MTSFSLKLFAVIAMTLDHIAKIIGQAGLMAAFPGLSMTASSDIMHLMDGIGRIAFPLYAFMIAEGAARTRSMPSYIGRLMLFAVISEPFFYFAFHRVELTWGGFLDNLSRWNLSNVFVTLTLGAVAVFCYQLLVQSSCKKRLLVFVPVCGLLAFVGQYVGCDYGAAGILLIAALYLAKTKQQKIAVILIWSLWLYIVSYGVYVSAYNVMEGVCAALSGVLIWFYNGKRGRQVKWSFYIYYPAHLLVLILLGRLGSAA